MYGHATSVAIISILLCGCTNTVPLSKYETDKNAFRKALIYEVQGDAYTTLGILNELREHRADNAIELLEYEIDIDVAHLWNSMDNADEATKNGTLATLRKIKAYREKYPRVLVGDFGNKDLREMTEKARIEAEQILSQL